MDWFLYDNGLRHERVKDDLGGVVNEVDEFGRIYTEIYLKETELNLEHQSPLCILIKFGYQYRG